MSRAKDLLDIRDNYGRMLEPGPGPTPVPQVPTWASDERSLVGGRGRALWLGPLGRGSGLSLPLAGNAEYPGAT
jgi:hypothetical protein